MFLLFIIVPNLMILLCVIAAQGGTSATLNPGSEPKDKGLNNTMEGTGKEAVGEHAVRQEAGAIAYDYC